MSKAKSDESALTLLLAERNRCRWKIREINHLISKMSVDVGLSERERRVLEARKDGETLEEVGRTFGVTRARIRQIENKAHAKIDGNRKWHWKRIKAEVDDILNH